MKNDRFGILAAFKADRHKPEIRNIFISETVNQEFENLNTSNLCNGTVEGHRWAIEGSFETTKNELGLDHNESRYSMAGITMMAVIRHHANDVTPKIRTRIQSIGI